MSDDDLDEVRVFGPPGTGKTTWMSGAVRATAKSRRTSDLMVASFTVTAAMEIAGRGLPIDRSQVGTLHSMAYRSIGRPQVAMEIIADWNKTHPALQLSGGSTQEVEGQIVAPDYQGPKDGDSLLMEADVLRARMIPEEVWPMRLRQFYAQWKQWKHDTGTVDFTDMISKALYETEFAPGEPVVGFFDEVQDFTLLELSLVRHWGRQMERIVLAGDDDQAIFSFKGALPDAFLDPPIPESSKRILTQSYRLPAAVQSAAQAWIEKLSRREPKHYNPRDAEGLVRRGSYRGEFPDDLVRDIAKQVDAGRSCMVLATCAFMLDRTKWALRAEGVPFHNPYRRGRGDWNPLAPARGVSSAERLVAYLVLDERLFGELSRPWTGEDVKRWTAVVQKKGVFRRGSVGEINQLPDRELTYEEVSRLFVDEAELAAAVEPSLDWFERKLTAQGRQALEFPIRVVRKRGPMALVDEPKVTLGTIHSVKGGESDVVYLLPDLSLPGMREWDQVSTRDSVIRLMYVGMTRAREELVLCEPSSPMAVDPHLMWSGR